MKILLIIFFVSGFIAVIMAIGLSTKQSRDEEKHNNAKGD